jgi:hypothetical protein
MKPGIVVYDYNPSYLGDIGRRTKVEGQPKQKL